MKHSSHRISIPTILEVGPDSLLKCGSLLEKNGFKHVFLYFGDGIYTIVGDTLLQSISSVNVHFTICKNFCSIQIQDVFEEAFTVPSETDLIIGVGGGKVLDASKYIAFIKKIPFISIPTSTSNDSFSSSGVSLIYNGKRVSLHAKMPYGLLVDTNILKSAPLKFIYSGIGDLLSNITAIDDWKFEEAQGKAIVNDFSMMIADKAIYSFMNTPYTTLHDETFLKALVDSLTLNGIAMEIAGDSAPASGSEHLISHALDTYTSMNQLHGIQVGIATYIMSYIQNNQHNAITQVLNTTGFFDYVATLNLSRADFITAITKAALIKPNRLTAIHQTSNQEAALNFIHHDHLLQTILND